MQIIDNKVLIVRTRRPHLITDVIKKSAVVNQEEDVYEVAVNWELAEAQQLAKMRVKNVPSTIERDYDWTGKLKPFAHQKLTASFLTLNPKSFCFNEQGTGKTASAIWAADFLMKQGLVRRVLVLCPLSIMKAAWQQDLFKFAMHRSCSIAHGAAKQRVKVLEAGSDFVICNFDGLAVIKDEVMAGGFDLIIVDEASAYKNVTTNRWKVLKAVSDKCKWLWMMTGTPAAQSPLDAFGLIKLINQDAHPKYLGQFRDAVMYKVSQFRWVAKPSAKDFVHKQLQPAIRFERDQCLDLPEVTFVERDAPLTPQQNAAYKMLKNQMRMEAAGEEISAINAAVQINKLLQISGGSIYTDTKAVIDFDVSNRLEAVLEVVEESSHKVLIFVPFTHTIEVLHKYLTKHKVACEVINGKVPMNKRSEIVKQFQEEESPRVLIIQPQAAAHGLTLTAANTIIWYAPVTSVETYLQANARINRPGQKNAMTIVHIKGSEVESRLYTMLQNNIMNHTKIIDLYRQEIEES
jgi:SNF2 family DNA or RNA helicase